MKKTKCVYCEELKYCRTWQETGESVCHGCRESMLADEYKLELIQEVKDAKLFNHNLDRQLEHLKQQVERGLV